MGYIELFLCTGDRNVSKTALLFKLARVENRLHSGEDSVLHSGQENNGKFKSLCRMDSHEHHSICRIVVSVNVGNKSVFLQKACQRRLLVRLRIFNYARNKFLEVFESFRLFLACVDKHLAVSGSVKCLIYKNVKGHLANKA